MERDWLVRAGTSLLTALVAESAVLAITGVALFFLYRPTAGRAWGDVSGPAYGWDVRAAWVQRLVHRLASSVAVLTAAGVGVVLSLRASGDRRRWAGPAVGAGLVVLAWHRRGGEGPQARQPSSATSTM